MLTPEEQDQIVRQVTKIVRLARTLDTRVSRLQIDPRTAKRSLDRQIERLRDQIKEMG
jgi:hypothetical protein